MEITIKKEGTIWTVKSKVNRQQEVVVTFREKKDAVKYIDGLMSSRILR